MKNFILFLVTVFFWIASPGSVLEKPHTTLPNATRFWYSPQQEILPDGWFQEGSELVVLNTKGEWQKVTGWGVEFSGRCSRVTAFIYTGE